MRIQLIVTGDAERAGFAASLLALFPQKLEIVVSKVNGITSNRLGKHPGETPIPTIAHGLAAMILAGLEPGRRREGSIDMVLAVDDLEIANIDQPGVVVDYLVEELRLLVRSKFPLLAEQNRIYGLLSSKASFHLLCPMLESYFFADVDALKATGAAVQKNRFSASVLDVERFEVADPAYDSVRQSPWSPQQWAQHAKHYVEYLCGESIYSESDAGRGLALLKWQRVIQSANDGWVQFARAMHEDLAEFLAVPTLGGTSANPTRRRTPGFLRNAGP